MSWVWLYQAELVTNLCYTDKDITCYKLYMSWCQKPTTFNQKANPMVLYKHLTCGNAYLLPFLVFTMNPLSVALYSFVWSFWIYITFCSCCCQDWPENRQKGRSDTWFIYNRLSLPNLSLRLPTEQPRQIDLRIRNSGVWHMWLEY